jgi:hypothetical protein
MPSRLLLIALVIFFFREGLFAQEIKLAVSDKPLNQVLIEIRDAYKVQLSFDDSELSKYKVTAAGRFSGIEYLLIHLLRDLPYDFEKISGVYVIYPRKSTDDVPEKPKIYNLSGRIMENGSREFLPYTQLVINSFSLLCDQSGYFSFSSATDSVFRIRVMQLGYFVKDTLIYRGRSNLKIYLHPADQLINEITINENLVENFFQLGKEPATIKLNHKISKYLPGSSDNSVFNLLRLQPGILASGEQSNDIIIWGSYPGQSRVYFDGINVFGLKNFNDNISPINPLITKNIQIKKAAYDASWGDCIGGIVDISGKEGNTDELKLNLGINNFTVNGLLEIPVIKKSSLQLAYRQTFYNLYRNGIDLFPRTSSESFPAFSEIKLYPDYLFRDMNIKYSVKGSDNLFYISFLKGMDQFSYSISQTRQYRDIVKNTLEKNARQGLSLFYDYRLNRKINLALTLSQSTLISEINNEYEVFSTLTGRLVAQEELFTKNNIVESRGMLRGIYQGNKNHSFELDLQAVQNHSIFRVDSSGINLIDDKKAYPYYTLAMKEILRFRDKKLNVGMRTSYLPYLQKFFFEPRVSFSQSFNEKFIWHLAWGKYRQFLVKSTVIDQYGNYNYFWTIVGLDLIPIPDSEHWVAGFSFNANKVWFNLDAFLKTTHGISRYFTTNQLGSQGIYEGNGRSFGLDLYSKYNFGRHTIWLSYTLSKTLEHFSYFGNDDYLFAPQDQRHEIKAATIIDLKPFYLSVDYVFGSGFLERPFQQLINQERKLYSRLDVAATYRFERKNIQGECGISILNLLNTENRKFSDFEKIPLNRASSVSLYFEAVPFTPTIFLKLTI